MIRRFPLLVFVLITTALIAADPRGDNPDAPPSTPQDQLAKFHVPPGFEVQLVAAEPEIQKPINLTFDAAGRLWVTGSEMYPWPAKVDANGQPIPGFDKTYTEIATTFHAGDKAPPAPDIARDTVRILSDFGPDGRARRVQVFAEGLNIPSGVQPLPHGSAAIKAAYGLGPGFDANPAMVKRGPIADRHLGKSPKGDSAIVYSIPNIWLLTDWDGDGTAEGRLPLYTGFGFVDTHGGASSFLYWIDGWIYGTHGFKNRSEVCDLKGHVTVLDSGNTFRFRPDGSAFEVYTHGQTNPFGLTVDPLGNFYSADSHSKPVYMLIHGGYYEGIGKQHDGLGFAPRITDDDHGSSSIAGITYYAAEQFPEEFRGNLFNGNPVTRKINRDKLEWHGSTPKAIRQSDFLSCDDPWFRPVQVTLGPDGALYIADFYNPIIGHYEVPLTDPRRDHSHGRIWRVVWRGENKDAQAPAFADLTTLDATGLVKKLADPNLIARTLATNELVDRVGHDALPALRAALRPLPSGVNETAAQHAHALIAGLRIEKLKLGTEIYDWFQAARIEGQELSRILSLKFIAEDHPWAKPDFEAIRHALTTSRSPMVRRAAWELFSLQPPDVGFGGVGAWLGDLDRNDPFLTYQAKVAAREYFKKPLAFDEVGQTTQHATTTILESLLAVPTPEAAAFLLSYLKRTKLKATRAGVYLKHAILHLPAEELDTVAELFGQADDLPLSGKLALATNLAEATQQRDLKLPDEITTWSQRTMLEALASRDDALVKRGIEAVRETKLEAKLEPLTKIAHDEKRDHTLRRAALEATANLPESRELLVAALDHRRPMILRKRAAELLAQNGHTEVVLAALPNAPNELAIAICAGLAKSDAGASALLDAVDANKTSGRFLTNKAVVGPFLSRSKALQDRATAMTRNLPPEDTRLDAVIAERAAAFGKAKPDATHGAQIFQQNCAACHRFRNTGGNVGPNLDGVIARGPARLIEDILDPNRNVDPLFRQTTIETTDDDTLLGANLRDQGDAILFADPTGKDITIPKAKIKKQTASGLSLMPPIYETAIPSADFNDLLGYLLSPAPTP